MCCSFKLLYEYFSCRKKNVSVSVVISPQRAVNQLDSCELHTADPITVVASVVAYTLGTQKGFGLKLMYRVLQIFSEIFPTSDLGLVERKEENTVCIQILACKGLHKTVPSKCFCSFPSGTLSLLDVPI